MRIGTIVAAVGCTVSFGAASAQTADTVRGEETVHEVEKIVVTGTRYGTDARLLPMTVSVVDRREIENEYQPSLLPTITRHVPGLFTTSRGIMGYGVSAGASGGMTMRGVGNGTQGSPTTAMLVLIDGHPQYMGLMGHPIADAYQSMIADKVEVVRGPASVLYGSNAMGGVINIVTRKMREDGVRTNVNAGYGSYNTLQSEVSNRIKAGRFTSVITGSYNRSDGHRKNMGFEQYGGYVKIGYSASRHWDIEADVNLTHFNASNPGSVQAPVLDNDSRITRGAASAAVRNEYEKTSGALSFFYNWGRHKIDDGHSEGEPPPDYMFNSKDKMMGVSWYQSVRMFRGNRLTAGVDYQYFGGKAWNRYNDGHDATTADKTMHEIAGYLDFRQSVSHWLTLNAGIRLDRHSHVGTEWIPQAGIAFHLSKSAELKATVGKGFRFPTIREMYMFQPQNSELRPERLMNYELSFSQRLLGGALSYGVNVFYIDGQDIIMRVPVNGRPKYINTGKIKNCGAEAELSCAIGRSWSVTANYSYLHMKYPVVAAPEHKLYAEVDFSCKRWSFSTGVQYVHGLYTRVDPVSRESFVLWSADGSFRVSKWLKIYARGENLLAQRYEINAGYPMPKATAMGGIDITF